MSQAHRNENAASAARSAPAWEYVVERLVAERGDALIRYAYFVSGSRDDAADLVQEALVKTFGRLRNGFTVESAEAYVRRAILNTWLDRGRKTTRWRKIAHLEVTPESAESTSSETESRIDLHEELHRLSPRERACLLLRYYDDLTVDAIAATLEISPGTVKRYLSDALAKMAAALSEPSESSANTVSPASTTQLPSNVRPLRTGARNDR